MQNRPFTYIANWKAYFTYNQACNWVTSNKQTLTALANHHNLVICPSFEALSPIINNLKGSKVQIGAQNCWPHKAGAFTGQVLAQSLQEIGCTYGIVGHPEVQAILNQTPATLALQALELLKQCLTPILFCGETKQDYDLDVTTQKLEQQLMPFFQAISQSKNTSSNLCIAYEPLWVADTNGLPETQYIKKQLTFIKKLATEALPSYTVSLLYAGNVNEITISQIKNIEICDGVIIGKASTDFQKLEKIVLS